MNSTVNGREYLPYGWKSWEINTNLKFVDVGKQIDQLEDMYVGKRMVDRQKGQEAIIVSFGSCLKDGRSVFDIGYYHIYEGQHYNSVIHHMTCQDFFGQGFKLVVEDLTGREKANKYLPALLPSWELKEKLLNFQIDERLNVLNKLYGNKEVVHLASGNNYRIVEFEIINYEGKSVYGVRYHPMGSIAGIEFENTKHTRPCHEFFDGRFEIKL